MRVPEIEYQIPIAERVQIEPTDIPERAQMPTARTHGPARAAAPISDVVEPDPGASVYTSQFYQQQQVYLETARRIEAGGVPIPGIDGGSLPPPYEVTLPRSPQTLINLSENGWGGVLPHNPFVYYNYYWQQAQERISFVW
jgi:hypothetical protein